MQNFPLLNQGKNLYQIERSAHLVRKRYAAFQYGVPKGELNDGTSKESTVIHRRRSRYIVQHMYNILHLPKMAPSSDAKPSGISVNVLSQVMHWTRIVHVLPSFMSSTLHSIAPVQVPGPSRSSIRSQTAFDLECVALATALACGSSRTKALSRSEGSNTDDPLQSCR